MEDKRSESRQERKEWSAHHYEIMAKWTKEIALLLFASLVIQEIVISRTVATPFIVAGGIITLGAYMGALYLLRKS
ncbi:MAG: hypothetical protein G01um101466_74 [Parcubacteria group bacterium Gr01-1014_66]|nr:MAG: hypothetical protein G01um101466_74 [Parcubacteria group bacterium Gr01-1014_66]